ncbi:MAG: hypothetical protein EKK59_09530 [Neisseriaceae bacterium]|nr:MAG: hypothetical protein EKK59_09530 [Neisseriaceae bacterium]
MTNRNRILDNSNRQAQLVLDSFSSISPLYYWAARIDIRAFFCLFFAAGAGETLKRDCTEKLLGCLPPPSSLRLSGTAENPCQAFHPIEKLLRFNDA